MSCNGCTKCCDVPTLFNQYIPHRIRKGISDLRHWKKISKRRAKKRNPHLIGKIKLDRIKTAMFFKCVQLSDNGCLIHPEKPDVCSGYPRYDYDSSYLKKLYPTDETHYTPHCDLIASTRNQW